MGNKLRKAKKQNRVPKKVEGIVIPDTLPILDNPAILPNQNFSVLGLGRCNVSGGKASFDLNPETVRQSLDDLRSKIQSGLTSSLGDFYQKDKNTYHDKDIYADIQNFKFTRKSFQLQFNINPYILALNEIEFTYVYKFHLYFSDGDITVSIDDKIENLMGSLYKFRNELVKACNDYIEPNANGYFPRKESEFNLKPIEQIFNNCKLSELQKHAPVLSAIQVVFQRSQVDAMTVKTNNLGTRCINVGEEDKISHDPRDVRGKFNQVVFDLHCSGMNDYDIAKGFGVMNLRALSSHLKGEKWGGTFGSYVARDAFFSFCPGVCWANDALTVGSSSGLAKTPGLGEAIGTLRNGNASGWVKKLDKISSKLVAGADLGKTFWGLGEEIAAFAAGGPLLALLVGIVKPNGFGVGAFVSQGATDYFQSKSIFENRVSLPESVLKVLDKCYVKKRFVQHTLDNIPSQEEMMKNYNGWQTSDGKFVKVGVPVSGFDFYSKQVFGRSGSYEGPTPKKKKK